MYYGVSVQEVSVREVYFLWVSVWGVHVRGGGVILELLQPQLSN